MDFLINEKKFIWYLKIDKTIPIKLCSANLKELEIEIYDQEKLVLNNEIELFLNCNSKKIKSLKIKVSPKEIIYDKKYLNIKFLVNEILFIDFDGNF